MGSLGATTMKIEDLDRVLSVLDESRNALVERLRAAVAIQSVSNDPDRYSECVRMAEFLVKHLKDAGVEVRTSTDTGTVEGPGGGEVPVPPIILGTYGNDPTKTTICAYGHYDVMPAKVSEGWHTDPFELLEDGDVLRGRGASDDKGPVLSWIAVIEAYQTAGLSLPVNLKLIFEGREEAGSQGVELLLKQELAPSGFFSDVDFIVISDSGTIGSKPCITYGLRGVIEFHVIVSGPKDNLHSGLFGGPVREPMHDLLKLMSSLTDDKGEINIPAVNAMVLPVTKEERSRYDTIEFDAQRWIKDSTLPGILGDTTAENVLMRRWRYPSLSIHGIQASSDFMATCIPAKCKARFSIRTVPDLHTHEVQDAVKAFLKEKFDELNSCNRLEIEEEHGADWFLGDVNDDSYKAARRAHVHVHGVEPDLIREGGSIPITISFSKLTGKSVCLLPICGSNDNIHGPNEIMEKANLFNGVKVMASYLFEMSK